MKINEFADVIMQATRIVDTDHKLTEVWIKEAAKKIVNAVEGKRQFAEIRDNMVIVFDREIFDAIGFLTGRIERITLPKLSESSAADEFAGKFPVSSLPSRPSLWCLR